MQYRLSGRVLGSDLDLPLPETRAPSLDAALVWRDRDGHPPEVTWIHDFTTPDGHLWLRSGAIDGGFLLRYPGLVDFHVLDRKRTVVAHGTGDVAARTVGHLFLAQVWPMLLSQWGYLVLHASAVAIDGRAVAFVGRSGRGKSTLAAGFNREGHALLTDDLLVLESGDGDVRALPSYAEQRLWSDSAGALFGTSAAHDRVAPYTDKLSVDVERAGRRFNTAPLPLARIYALGDPEDLGSKPGVTIAPCTLREAYVRLLDQTFRLDITDRERMREEVEQLTDLVHAVPVRHLAYPRRYDALGRVREAVLEDVRAD